MAELISATRRGSAKRLLQPRKTQKKCAYSTEFKRAVCRLVEENPGVKGAKLQELVKENFHWDVPPATLYDIVRGKDKWFGALSLSGFRQKESEWPELERELLTWCIGWVRRHGTLTYALLREQALLKAMKLGPESRPIRTKKNAAGVWVEVEPPEFRASSGRATAFCRRNGLKMRRRCGAGGDANVASADIAKTGIPYILETLHAKPEDVFNCDETGIVFGAQPHRTLAPFTVKGSQKRDGEADGSLVL